ncbi:Oligosaccharide translocation protein rft1 [Biomphalaria glabrata]|uniref:Protein RFT1 homolog n=2 Tax=Biomphalaria glabrata TaxID=6526 RepID=A0A9W3AEW7_BIOGL|nr:protein RFT1 homolog isoform X1 [Biomphalaria glabrata]XP_055885744.1 protein RFT1 homolog isoform X1 [Biomphalaria glabrata]KAI8749559.1 protein RFT1-like protein [Biomphalaria glabrata]
MKSSALLSGAAKAASYNMLLQLALRMTTFVLNAFILRYISKDLLGIVNVRLTLLYSTTLFLAKEAFDRACLSKSEERDWRQVINLLWCTFPIALIWCGSLGYIWLYVLDNPDSTSSITGYTAGVICYSMSTAIEVLAEPLFVVGQSFLFVKLKVVLLGISQGIKCILTVFLVLMQPQWGIINFSIAQLVSSIVYVTLYHGYFAHYILKNKKDDDFPLKSIRDMYPRIIPNKPFIDLHMASLTWSFFKQSFLKQILTEGEKYIMTFFDVLSFADQGIYDVINNLGSLAARFVFLPIEESSYLFFSQILTRGSPAHKQSQDSLRLCASVLGVLLKAVSLIGAIILVFGYSNAYLALHLYGGEILSTGSGPLLLRWYCLYVLFIAVNGTTEAFVFAAMSKEEVDKYNKKMLLFSGLFLFSSWLLTSLIGSVGFILANCLNMVARIIHSLYFISEYFHNTTYHPLYGVVPCLPVVFSLIVSLLVTSISEMLFCTSTSSILYKVIHIVVSGACLLFVLATTYFKEQRLVQIVKEQLFKHKTDKSR